MVRADKGFGSLTTGGSMLCFPGLTTLRLHAEMTAEPSHEQAARFSLNPGPDKNIGKLYFSRDFPERVPAQMQWSPNSRYLVLTTRSSGGHSPWHDTTYILSIPRRQIVSPDETIGPVVSPKFSFKLSGAVVLEIEKRGAEGIDFEHPVETDVDVSRLFSGKK